MTDGIRASVVIVTYNSAAVVARCLEALRATLSPVDEVLVVDNASRDGTAEQIAARYPWVRLRRAARNLGYGAANNLAVAHAAGRYIVFLNPDTVPHPGWLDALVATLAAHERPVLCTPKLVLAAEPGRVDACGNEVHISGITVCRGFGQPVETFQAEERVGAVSGACFALPRTLFGVLDGFDERLFLYYEDTELSLRARLAGYDCLVVPAAVVAHDHSGGLTPAKLRYLERNRPWSLLKLLRWRTLVALSPVLVAAELGAWTMAIARGPAYVKAKLQATRELGSWLPELAAARAGSQALRARSDADLLRLHGADLSFSQVTAGPAARPGEALARLVFGSVRQLALGLASHDAGTVGARPSGPAVSA
ncbi:MAG: glycosyltransferase family 2 protein [Chloroflexi bacterium]|nr:glycosyltransferase family 2 protein [Chloroflexota bacterium]